MASRVDILISAEDRASSAFRSTAASAQTMGQQVTAAGQQIVKAGVIMTAITGPLLLAAKGAVQAAEESAKVSRITEQIVQTTGSSANLTADQIGRLSTAISLKTGVDDEAIQSAANMLLMFKSVREEVGEGSQVFTRATAAMVDLAAAGFGSVESNAVQLGKALEDPIKGMGALAKAGVTFSADQQAAIKTMVDSNNLLGAQKMILDAVEGQVGGVGAASASAADLMRVAVGNMQESLGAVLLPIVESVASKVAELAARFGELSPGMQQMVVIGLAIAAAIGPLVMIIGGLMAAFGAIGLATGLVLAAIVALVAGLVWLYRNNEDVRRIMDDVWSWAKTNIPAAIETIRAAVRSFVDGASALWAEHKVAVLGAVTDSYMWFVREVVPTLVAIGGAIQTSLRGWSLLWQTHGAYILAAVRASWNVIEPLIRGVMTAIAATITAVLRAIRGDWTGAWEAMRSAVSGVMTGINQAVSVVLLALPGLFSRAMAAAAAFVASGMASLWSLILLGMAAAKNAVSVGISAIEGFFRALPGRITSALGDLSGLLVSAGKNIIQGLIDGLDARTGGLLARARSLASSIKAAFGDVMRFGSPSRVFIDFGTNIMHGLQIGLETGSPGAINAIRRVAEAIVKQAERMRDAVSAVMGLARSSRTLISSQEGVADATVDLAAVQQSASTISARLTAAHAAVTHAMERGEDGAADLSAAQRIVSDLQREQAGLAGQLKTAQELLTTAEYALIDAKLAQYEAGKQLEKQGGEAITMWEQYARSAGLAQSEIERISKAIDALKDKTITVTVVHVDVPGPGGSGGPPTPPTMGTPIGTVGGPGPGGSGGPYALSAMSASGISQSSSGHSSGGVTIAIDTLVLQGVQSPRDLYRALSEAARLDGWVGAEGSLKAVR